MKKKYHSNQSCIYRSPGIGSSSTTAPRAAGVGSASRESGDGRDVGGPGGEGGSSPRRKPGLEGAAEGEEVARFLPVPGEEQTSSTGRCGPPAREQAVKAVLRGTQR